MHNQARFIWLNIKETPAKLSLFAILLTNSMKHQYTLSDLPASRKRIEITSIAPETLEKSEKKALQEFSKELKIKGFRPGHIPENIVREQVNPEYLKMRSIDFALPEAANDVLREQKDLRVIERPELKLESMDPLKVVLEFDVYPEVKLSDYSNITVKVEKKQVTDQQVQETIEDLQKRMATFTAVDRKAKNGDRVTVDFEGFDLEGKALPNTASKQHPVVIGSKSLIPGFEEELIGMQKAEEKSFEITFPKDYHAKDMAGKKVAFKVTAHAVEEIIPATIDEAFVEQVTGAKGNQEDLEKKIREELQAEFDRQFILEKEEKTYEELLKKIDTDVPKSLLEQEKQALLREIKQKILYQGLSYEKYLQTLGKDESQLLETFDQQAADRIRLQLAFAKIAEDEKVEVSDLEVEEQLDGMVKKYPENKQAEIKKQYEPGSEAYGLLQHQLRMKKVREKIMPQE
jgi:trigger factor